MCIIVGMEIHTLIKDLRRQMGKTQSQLAQESNISLPTLQNIEAGKANPGFYLIQSILKSLNHTVSFTALPPDWEALSSFGVPLFQKQAKNAPFAKWELLKTLAQALLYRKAHPQLQSSREWEALAAFLLALKMHFPLKYDELKELKIESEQLIQSQDDGRLVKLRRIALARQALYL